MYSSRTEFLDRRPSDASPVRGVEPDLSPVSKPRPLERELLRLRRLELERLRNQLS